jgi:thiol:disulfide interchange protein DsbC
MRLTLTNMAINKATNIAANMVTSMAGLCLSFLVGAQSEQEMIAKAEMKFKATFVNSKAIKSFGPSPIEGLYHMQTLNGLMYYYPDKELLVFGKIYDKNGVDLSAQVERASNQKLIDTLPLESALVLGSPDAETSYVEITNPYCGHCINYSRWADKQDSSNIKRYVFFFVTDGEGNIGEGRGKEEAIHILCHPEDYSKIYNRQKMSLKTCEEGRARFDQHSAAMKLMSPTGTPSFIVDGRPFVGFDEALLTNLYRKTHVQ